MHFLSSLSLISCVLLVCFSFLLSNSIQANEKEKKDSEKIYTYPTTKTFNPFSAPLISPILILKDKGTQNIRFNAFPFAGDSPHYIHSKPDSKGRDFMALFSVSRQLAKATDVLGTHYELRTGFRRYIAYLGHTNYVERIAVGFEEVTIREAVAGYMVAHDDAFVVHAGAGWQQMHYNNEDKSGPKLFYMIDYFDKPYKFNMKSGYALNLNMVDFSINMSYMMKNLEASLGYKLILFPQDTFQGPEAKLSLWL